MWTAHQQSLLDQDGIQFTLCADANPITYGEAMKNLESIPEFRSFFNDILATSPFEAFRWETPPVSLANLSRLFEFVLLDSPCLDREPDQAAFAEHFLKTQAAVTFSNLGRDATLVVPCPIGIATAYGHLANFVRKAPPVQRDAMWQAVGQAMQLRINAKSVWLSTAGAGVSWLHVRLDDRPKYYGYAPYRSG